MLKKDFIILIVLNVPAQICESVRHVVNIKNNLKPQLTFWFLQFSLRSKKSAFKFERNNVVIIIDIEWYEKYYCDMLLAITHNGSW